jgi:hypothetical protein
MNLKIAEIIMESLTWISFFTAVLLSFYFYLKFRYKERIALIEKGVESGGLLESSKSPFKFPWIKLSMLSIGIGVGVILQVFINSISYANKFPLIGSDRLIVPFALIFGGLGAIFGNYLERKQKRENG